MINKEYLLNYFKIKDPKVEEMMTQHIHLIDFDIFMIREATMH